VIHPEFIALQDIRQRLKRAQRLEERRQNGPAGY
jgi:hypothetical protein